MNKASKITPSLDSKEQVDQPSGLKDDANNIQDETNIQTEVSNAVIKKESQEIAVHIEKEYHISSEAKEEATLKASLIFSNTFGGE